MLLIYFQYIKRNHMTYQNPDHVPFKIKILNILQYIFHSCYESRLFTNSAKIYFLWNLTKSLHLYLIPHYYYAYIDDVFRWQYYK